MSLVDALYQLTPSPWLLLLLILLISLVESLALVGLLVPGVVLITAAGSLAGHQDVAIPAVLSAAFVGAVLGDGISFSLGYSQRERVMQRWPLSQHPEWLARGARFFKRYGTLSVFFGRFVGPVRPIIPLVAGMLHMSPRTFAWANIVSAALWAPAYVLPGYLLGRSWQKLLELPAELEAWLITLAIILLFLALMFSWGRAQLVRNGRVYGLVAGLARRFPLLRRPWLAMGRQGEVPLASSLLLIVSLGSFSGWTLVVLAFDGPLPIDLQIQQLFSTLQFPMAYYVSEALARLGDSLGIIALILPWAMWMLWRRHMAALLHWAAALGGIALLNTWGKAVFGRVRPETPDYLLGSLAYPSAHTSTAVVVFGLAAAFFATVIPHARRFWLYWGAVALVTPMALSRLVLGYHWFSDVIGGAMLGLIVCSLINLSWQSRTRLPLWSCPWHILAIASAVLAACRIFLLPAV
ncbi:bifunctional DedA family/phosphatase PAP2 family protein [Halomonas sp. Bachu 37]|uniref:bifunctional DedA family/phosphatase PAP2 family protein n=1 Tax=Halomonas kashgarensis TaxID=3084920 RepID=UPI0032176903